MTTDIEAVRAQQRAEMERLEAIRREACDRPKGYASPGYDWNGVIGAGAVFTPKSTAIGQKAPESTDEEITGLFRQLIKDVANAAVHFAAWPPDVDAPIKAVADRRGEIAEYLTGYALEIEPPESLRKLLALLRAPRGENDLRKAVTAYTDALDVYRQECRTRDIPLVEYDYPEWQRLAEPLMEAERALRAALAARDTTRPNEAR